MKAYCCMCGKVVAEIEKGSRIRKETSYICKECAEYMLGKSSPIKGDDKRYTETDFDRIFGGIFKGE